MTICCDPPFHLTCQQQSIIAHNHGPAIVFAVAGAGKTTAIEHRIARLVQGRVFAPDRILVTAFNAKNAQELTERLKKWPSCDHVSAKTLNALGNAIMRQGFQSQLLAYLNRQAFEQLDLASDRIFNTARSVAFCLGLVYILELVYDDAVIPVLERLADRFIPGKQFPPRHQLIIKGI